MTGKFCRSLNGCIKRPNGSFAFVISSCLCGIAFIVHRIMLGSQFKPLYWSGTLGLTGGTGFEGKMCLFDSKFTGCGWDEPLLKLFCGERDKFENWPGIDPMYCVDVGGWGGKLGPAALVVGY